MFIMWHKGGWWSFSWLDNYGNANSIQTAVSINRMLYFEAPTTTSLPRSFFNVFILCMTSTYPISFKENNFARKQNHFCHTRNIIFDFSLIYLQSKQSLTYISYTIRSETEWWWCCGDCRNLNSSFQRAKMSINDLVVDEKHHAAHSIIKLDRVWRCGVIGYHNRKLKTNRLLCARYYMTIKIP